MSVQGLDEFARPLDAEPVLQRAAGRAQARLAEALQNGIEVGTGQPLAPNRRYTVKRKGHGRVGIDTGDMAEATIDPTIVSYSIAADGGEVVVPAGPGRIAWKINLFVHGHEETVVKKTAKRKSGAVVAWDKAIPQQAPRDYIGHDERDIDADLDDAATDVFKQWGFKEA